MGFFNKNILINDEEMKHAVRELKKLSKEYSALKKEIEDSLINLEKGFDTPAGRKFVKTYKQTLIKPMKQQVEVIDHVCTNMSRAELEYRPLFEEYKTLNRKIKDL